MITIIIQGVQNGGIVRPFNPCQFPTVHDQDECSVFTNVAELQAALPDLLRTAHPANAVSNPPHEN